MYTLSFFGQFFLQTFLLYNWILQKSFNFCKFANIFADSKSRAQELSNDVSVVKFGHQTWFSRSPAGIGLKINKSRI